MLWTPENRGRQHPGSGSGAGRMLWTPENRGRQHPGSSGRRLAPEGDAVVVEVGDGDRGVGRVDVDAPGVIEAVDA